MGKLLTTSEVCKILHVSRMTLYKYVNSGMLRRIKFGTRIHRYDAADVNKFMKENKTGESKHV